MQICEVILGVHRHPLRAVRVHLLRLSPDEVERGQGGLKVTSPTRTALDCLAGIPFGPALDLWAWVCTRQILDQAALLAAITERRNWSGTAQLRRIQALTAGGAVSQAELRLHELLHLAGVTGWTANCPVSDRQGRIGVVDLLFPAARVVIEVDGWRAHSSHGSFIDDRRRQNALVAAGFTVLRFTWEDLTQHPDQVMAQIRTTLGAAQRSLETTS